MINKKYIDLHVHSKASDGELSVLELVHRAQVSGLAAIAITDHDTIKGIREYMDSNKKSEGMEVIPGVEVSTIYKNDIIHILVYTYKLDGQLATIIENLKKRNLRHYIDYKKGLRKEIQCEYIDVFNLLQVVKEDGGVSILAHPKRVCTNYKELIEIILDLASHGLDGIESFHRDNSFIEQIGFNLLARKYNLLSTGGSDFHGNSNRIEQIYLERNVSYKYLDKLKKRMGIMKNDVK